MQVSKIFRRGIVLPKTSKTLGELAANNVSDESELVGLPISESLFTKLWDGLFFANLNSLCGINIDDFEETFLPKECVSSAERFVSARMLETRDAEVQAFYHGLVSLLKNAQLLGHAVLFVL